MWVRVRMDVFFGQRPSVVRSRKKNRSASETRCGRRWDSREKREFSDVRGCVEWVGPTSLASYLPQLLDGLQHPRDGPVASAHQDAQVGHHPDVAPQRRGRSLRGQIHDLHRVDVVAVREQLHERRAPATAALAVHEAQQRSPPGRRRLTRRLGRPGRARLVPLHALLVRRPGARGRVRARDVPRPRARRGKRRGRPSSSPGRSLRGSSESRSAPARARHPSRRRRRGGGGERRHRERGHRAHHARVSE